MPASKKKKRQEEEQEEEQGESPKVQPNTHGGQYRHKRCHATTLQSPRLLILRDIFRSDAHQPIC